MHLRDGLVTLFVLPLFGRKEREEPPTTIDGLDGRRRDESLLRFANPVSCLQLCFAPRLQWLAEAGAHVGDFWILKITRLLWADHRRDTMKFYLFIYEIPTPRQYGHPIHKNANNSNFISGTPHFCVSDRRSMQKSHNCKWNYYQWPLVYNIIYIRKRSRCSFLSFIYPFVLLPLIV